MGSWCFILVALLTVFQPKAPDPGFKILLAHQYSTGDFIGLYVGLKEEPRTVEEYKRICCRIIESADLTPFMSRGVKKKRISDYSGWQMFLELGYNPVVFKPTTVGPTVFDGVEENTPLGLYFHEPGRHTLLDIYRENGQPVANGYRRHWLPGPIQCSPSGQD